MTESLGERLPWKPVVNSTRLKEPMKRGLSSLPGRTRISKTKNTAQKSHADEVIVFKSNMTRDWHSRNYGTGVEAIEMPTS
jgi:hypothetical protein